MAFAEKKKPREIEGLDVKAELTSALKANGVPEFGARDDITRIAKSIEEYSYSFNEEETREFIGNIAKAWGEVEGLRGDEFDNYMTSEQHKVSEGKGDTAPEETGGKMEIVEPAFGDSGAVERGPENIRDRAEEARAGWSEGARELRRRREEGAPPEAKPPVLEVAKAETVSKKAHGEKKAEKMEKWLAEKGFSSSGAREKYGKLAEKISEAERKGYLAEKEKLMGEVIAHLNEKLGELKAIRDREAEKLNPELREELEGYISRIDGAKKKNLGIFLESRYERIGKPAIGNTIAPNDMEVREIYSLSKEELVGKLVAHKLDAETEVKDEFRVVNYSSELEDLGSIEKIANGASEEKDKAALYKEAEDLSSALIVKMEGQRGLFKNDPVLLAEFNRRLEELRRKQEQYLQKTGGAKIEEEMASAKKSEDNGA